MIEKIQPSFSTLGEAVAYWADLQPDRPALVDSLGTVTYNELAELADRTGQLLAAHDIGSDDVVAIVSTSAPATARALVGISCYSACAPLDPTLSADDLRVLFRRMRVAAVVADKDEAKAAKTICQEFMLPMFHLMDGGIVSDQPFPAGWDKARVPAAASYSIMRIALSSGTTGLPKIMPTTHARNMNSYLCHVREFGLTPDDSCMNPMPLFHGFGATTLMTSIVSGGSCVCLGRFDHLEFAHWVRQAQTSWYVGSPLVHTELARRVQAQPELLGDWRARMTETGSATLPPAIADTIIARLATTLIESYSASETGIISLARLPPSPSEPYKVGSVGRPVDCEVLIKDPGFRSVPAGELGEIVVRGRSVIAGYLDDPEANSAAFTSDGWYRTGDLGWLDEEGYLFLGGRVTDIINRGGSKVAPLEIEQWLLAWPDVAIAVVFGMPHPGLGEDVVAAIVPTPNGHPDPVALRVAMLAAMPGYKVPSRIAVVEQLPLGPAGKVRRSGLPELLREAMTPPHRAPVTALEQKIAQLFGSLLDVEDVGLDDDFMGLGGHSLLALLMLDQLEKHTGQRVTPAEFIRDPSVAGLAALLEAPRSASFHPAIEPYRITGSGPALFIAPGVDGHPYAVHPLLAHLPPDWRVFGIRAPDGERDEYHLVRDTATFCVERLREVQPQGPYWLAGYSLGGNIAQEMAF